MRRFSYEVKINGVNYNFTRIADSSTFNYVAPLCSNDKKSGNGTASVNIKGGADTTWYQTFMQALLTAQQNKVYGDCEVTITDNTTHKVVHRGWLNLNELSISSTSFPDSLLFASKDKMQLLDSKIRYNQVWEDESRVQIVNDLIDMMNADLGQNVPYLSSELSALDTIDNFCVSEGKDETYREVIDRVLFEAVGYVLWYDPDSNGFRIKQIPTTVDPETTYRIIKFRLENKLITQSAVYPNDGILLSYPTIIERPNTNIYNDDIDISTAEDGTVIGQSVLSGDYFPENGDIKEIYQEYSVPDRAYISHESRLENKDLLLIYAKDVSYILVANPALTIAPALPNVDWDGTPHFYPDRARILFKNTNTGNSNVTTFSITGTAVYIESFNKFSVPDNCTNPEEYTVSTITDAVKAKAFADWYYNSKRYGCTMSKWSEPEGNSTLGEIVMVQHKDTGIQMPHVIVQMTDSCAGGQSGTIRMKEIIAISLYGWQSVLTQTVPQTTKPNVQKPVTEHWYTGNVLLGTSTARGVAGNVGDWYLNNETYNLYRCIIAGNSYSALWEYKGNIKGEDVTLEGYTYAIEYGLSDSPTEFHFPDGNIGYTDDNYGAIDPDDNDDFEYAFLDYDWSANVNGWHKGLYVWQRLKVTDSEGVVTFEDPIYAEEITLSLINGCVFDIMLTDADGDGNTHTWEKNLASANGMIDVQFRVIARSYGSITDFETALSSGDGVSITPYKGQTPLTPFITPTPSKSIDINSKTVSFIYNLSFAKKLDYDSLVFNASISDTFLKSDNSSWTVISRATETMTAVDITSYDVFGGIFTSDADAEDYFSNEYGGVIEGYTYSYSHEGFADHLSLKTYFNGAWLFMTNLPSSFSLARVSAICGKAQKQVMSQIPQGSVSMADFGYFNIVIANVVTARFIGSKQIQLQVDDEGNAGYIYGGDVTPSQTFKNRVGQKGFIIDTLGQMEASSSYFKNSEIDGASIISSLVFSNGAEINHPFLKTISTQGQDMAVQSLPSKTHWYTGDINWSSVLPTANSFTSFSNSYINNTETIDWGIRVTDPSHQLISSGTTVGSASITGGGSATLISSIQYKGTYTLSMSLASGAGAITGLIYVNGTDVLAGLNGQSKSTTMTLNVGDRVTCNVTNMGWGSSSFSVKANSVTLSANGYTNIGIYLHGTSPDTLFFENTFNEYKASSVRWLFKNTVQTTLFDSDSHIDYAHLESIVSGYMSDLPTGKTFTATGSVTYNGVACTVATLSKDTASTGKLTIFDSVPNFYILTMSSSSYHNISGTVQILASQAGIETHALYPETTEAYDIGEGGKQYRRIYCVNVVESSRRDLKTNIEPFTDDAVKLLKTVEVSKYNYKADMDLPEEERIDYIGYIADDTDERLSGKQHDRFNHINCIGVLIKAVQELSAEIEELKGDKK